MAVEVEAKSVATKTENDVDLIVRRRKPLRLPGRLEMTHYFLSFPCGAMRDFDTVA